MTVEEFIGSIDNKTYNKIRSSQSDAECRRYLKEHLRKQLNTPAVSSSSFDDVEFIDALFAEYNKSYKETKPGQVLPRWLDDEQLKWVLTVAKNCT